MLHVARGAARAVILNNANVPRGAYGYYDSYYYYQSRYYYYGQDGEKKRRCKKEKRKKHHSESAIKTDELALSAAEGPSADAPGRANPGLRTTSEPRPLGSGNIK